VSILLSPPNFLEIGIGENLWIDMNLQYLLGIAIHPAAILGYSIQA
jgi:hypothetical protein